MVHARFRSKSSAFSRRPGKLQNVWGLSRGVVLRCAVGVHIPNLEAKEFPGLISGLDSQELQGKQA